jgi:16S rRNA G966 N2-methylase RsmD
MSCCCGPAGYERVFGPRFAHHLAHRYRRRGLDRTTRRIADLLAAQGIAGAEVLEIGGGVGDLQLELLRRGAARATNLELVDSYDADAAGLAASAGLADRVVRRRLDVAEEPGAVAAHDVVVLNRVVCCYPDHERLLGAAADHARRLLVFSHPPGGRAGRTAAALLNLGYRAARLQFRNYAHSPAAMLDVLRRHGLEPVAALRGPVWRVVLLARTGPGGRQEG